MVRGPLKWPSLTPNSPRGWGGPLKKNKPFEILTTKVPQLVFLHLYVDVVHVHRTLHYDIPCQQNRNVLELGNMNMSKHGNCHYSH
jgi:hypothetical protein